MSSQHCGIVLFAIVALLSCDITESSSNLLASFNVPSSDSVDSAPSIQNSVLQYVLQTQGTSLDQLRDTLASADGNVASAVGGINSQLNSEVLQIDRNELKLNPQGLVRLIKGGAQGAVKATSGNNPSLAAIITKIVNNQIDSQSKPLTDAIENFTIPLDLAQRLLQNDVRNREKRSLQPRDLSLESIISDLVWSVIQSQLGPTAINLLENLKQILLSYYTSTAPEDPIPSVIVFVQNTIIETLVNTITLIENSIGGNSTSANCSTSSRRKRAADETTTDDGTDVDSTGGGLLDVILSPILSLLGAILQLPLELVKGLVALVSGLLSPIVGNSLNDIVGGLGDALTNLLT